MKKPLQFLVVKCALAGLPWQWATFQSNTNEQHCTNQGTGDQWNLQGDEGWLFGFGAKDIDFRTCVCHPAKERNQVKNTQT